MLIEVVDGDFILGVVVHGRFQEEAEESLYAVASGTCCQVAEQTEVQGYGGGKDAVTAEEIDFDLHGIVEPAADVDIVPRLLVVVAGRIVVDAYLMVVVAVKLGLVVGTEDSLQRRELRHLLGVEVLGFVEHQTVAVAEDVGREPTVKDIPSFVIVLIVFSSIFFHFN